MFGYFLTGSKTSSSDARDKPNNESENTVFGQEEAEVLLKGL